MNNESNENNKADEINKINKTSKINKISKVITTVFGNGLEATKKKQIRNLALVIIVLVCVIGFLYFVISDNGSTGKSSTQEGGKSGKTEKAEFVSAIKHVDVGSVLIEKTEAKLAQVEKSTENLQRSVEELTKEKQQKEQAIPEEEEKLNILIKRIDELEKKITQEQTTLNTPPNNFSGNVFPSIPGRSCQQGICNNQDQPVLMTQGIRDDVITLAPNADVLTLPSKNPKDYVPSGTFVKAVTLGGADASAAVNAQSNPQPMLFRLIEAGTMPNNQKSRLKGCLATAAVVGDISSERGFIRLETLSCIDPETNRVIDLNVDGTVFGAEGKGGIRGIPMWREGALLQRAFAAGALSGLAGGVSQKYTTTSISPLGAIQSASSDAKDILARGAAGGIGNAMEKLADYNIKRAEQYHPVLQLSAGSIVDIVFLKGFYLSDKNSDGRQSKIMSAAYNVEAASSNLSAMSKLPLTPEQTARLKEYETESNR